MKIKFDDNLVFAVRDAFGADKREGKMFLEYIGMALGCQADYPGGAPSDSVAAALRDVAAAIRELAAAVGK